MVSLKQTLTRQAGSQLLKTPHCCLYSFTLSLLEDVTVAIDALGLIDESEVANLRRWLICGVAGMDVENHYFERINLHLPSNRGEETKTSGPTFSGSGSVFFNIQSVALHLGASTPKDVLEVVVSRHFTPNLWLENFRMSEATFEKLCQKYWTFVDLTTARTSSKYRVIGEIFGVSKTTVHRCVYAVCKAIRHTMLKDHIQLPNVEEARAIAQRNARAHAVPQVYGSLDGTHIPVLPPSDGYRDFVNRKGWPSIVLQAVVDDNYQIRDICVGTPGSAHDAAVLTTSNLFSLPTAALVDERVFWSKPIQEEESFNLHLSAIRVKVEHTFGHLKARWRILAKRSDVHHSFMPTVVAACCVLHNICEKEKQPRPPFLQDLPENNQPNPQPQMTNFMQEHRRSGMHLSAVLAITQPSDTMTTF
ncbi:hypothetical protein WMY93_001319 [Mugilogobius chulae]|uniref:DDE Tnp4 domain-containing protein n=1 Tax=Mugilogobius chulae TaxID=88201 RepID=A0AAW0Q1Z5_9GOBI